MQLRPQEANIDFALEFTTDSLDPDEAIVSLVSVGCSASTVGPFANQWTPDNDRIQGTTISGSVNGATTTSAGSGYTPNTTLTLTVSAPPAGGTRAQMTARVGSDGTVTGNPTVVDGGDGYVSAPTITYPAPGSGSTATGTATIFKNTLSVIVGDGTQNPGVWRIISAAVLTNQNRKRQSDTLLLYTPYPWEIFAS